MEIISTLRSNTSPDAAEQLFKTLTETSKEVKDATEEKKDTTMNIDGQLELLLDKLKSNSNLQASKEEPASIENPKSQQLITDAYRLINEVIMVPQIMWTRTFFYSLGAMSPTQQQIVHEWFIEMNEVSTKHIPIIILL